MTLPITEDAIYANALRRNHVARRNLPDTYIDLEHSGLSLYAYATTFALGVATHETWMSFANTRNKKLVHLCGGLFQSQSKEDNLDNAHQFPDSLSRRGH